MKKKILFSMVTILIFTILAATVVSNLIASYENTESVRQHLKNNNAIIRELYKYNKEDQSKSLKNLSEEINVRVTYIDSSGHVISDSMMDAETMDNHNNREEIIAARKSGEGSSVRYSGTAKQKMMYYATLLKDGTVIRSSMPVKSISDFHRKYLNIYTLIIILIFVLAIILSSRLSNRLVKPIKELEYVITKVAHGDLNKRIVIDDSDEIGRFGNAFNEMADRLRDTIKDGFDKQNRLEAILRSMESGVIAVDRDYKVIMINPYAEKIFGISKNVIGQNLMDNVRDFELENVFKNGNGEYKEIKVMWPKERELRIRTADIVEDKSFIGTVAVIQDTTDIKKLESMRSQFVANVSHELKTPLTSIKGFAETLRYVEDSAKREKFLDIIDDEANRLTRLINDILTLSDIENLKEKIAVEINVQHEVRNIYELLKQTAEAKNIKLQLINNGSAVIKGDRDRFKQMLLNLVDNAIKYSESGGRVCIGTEIEINQCVIWVKDTGVGISKDDLERIFERFYRVDKARSRKQGGTGLGLAIVKHIVLGLNGTIEVESEVLKGSKFIVRIPLEG